MIVISDTTPLISFLKIKRLDLLKTLFEIVQIPKSVFAELTENIKYRDEAEIIKNPDIQYTEQLKLEKSSDMETVQDRKRPNDIVSFLRKNQIEHNSVDLFDPVPF